MNRKLHNSLMALSTSGLLLVAALLGSQPTANPAGTTAAFAVGPDRTPMAAFERTALQAAVAEVRAHARSSADIGTHGASDPADAIARSARVIAAAATEAALAAVIAEADTRADAAADANGPARPPTHRGHRHAIAMPYFSFARPAHGNGD